MITPDTKTALAYLMLRGVGAAKLRQLALTGRLPGLPFGSDEPVEIPVIDRAIADRQIWRSAQDEALRQIDRAERDGVLIVSALDEAYPVALREARDAPFILFVRGSLPAADAHTVAVIGTRQPTRHGELVAKRVTDFLVREQRWIVSGLAVGCDSVAHRACIDAGGKTIAVLAHGLHTVAPASNQWLADAIVESGGALVTEYGFGVEPMPQQFVRRDYTQAGLSEGVVMIQSDLTGGSLHAARAAIKYRRWLAVPAPTQADREAGQQKIEANRVMADGSNEERSELLQCGIDELHLVRVLRSREDYAPMLLR